MQHRKSKEQRTAERTSRRKLARQRQAANKRAKYGATGKPSPVVVKSMVTGEVIVVPQKVFR